MTQTQRERVVQGLFDEMTSSVFAEGNEIKIAAGLNARTDEQLITLAKEKGTWVPE